MILDNVTDWSFTGKTGYHPVHLFHPYFAKFDPRLPRTLIKNLSKEGDTVLDPFSGCGTTLVEARLLGRHSIGIDANPVGCFIAQVKTTPIASTTFEVISNTITSIEQDIQSLYGIKTLFSGSTAPKPYTIPMFPNRDYWFTKSALNELGIIKSNVDMIPNAKLKNLLLLAFCRIILFSSNQETESKYRRVEKKRSPGDIFREFVKTVKSMQDAISDYSKQKLDVSVSIHNSDTRYADYLEPNSVDLLVTSPPYLNSWDYGLYQRFRFFWLGLDLKYYEDREIGKHLRTIEGRGKTDEVARYATDMGMCLKNFSRALKQGSYCCIVNANSIVRKVFIDTNEILTDQARLNGLSLIEVINRKVFGPHYGMHAALGSKQIKVDSTPFIEENGVMNKKEQILVFRKD